MITTPTSFTHEYLNSLKFKEIQKLSVQFHVNKRWAKKQELIDNLLALKEKNETGSLNNQENENEWKDGSTIFNDLNCNNDLDVNRRLTFNITTKDNVGSKGLSKEFEHEDKFYQQINSRETYDIPPKGLDLNVELLTESRATFDIPPKKKLIDGNSPTASISQNEKKIIKKNKAKTSNNSNSENLVNSDVEVTDHKIKGTVKFDLKDKELVEKNKTSKGTVLTIPYARAIRRTTKKDGEVPKSDDSPIRISQKSINIKKSTRLPIRKNNLVKSPAFSSVKKVINRQSITDSLKQSGRSLRSKVPIRLDFGEEISKPFNVKDNYKNQPPSAVKNLKVTPLNKIVSKNTNERNALGRHSSSFAQTPGNKILTGTKSITASKMPDFNRIHKKQFEQMDSLHDYIRKKEERARKLFGVPQPGQQLQVCNKSSPVFRFQSQVSDKESKENLNVSKDFKRNQRDAKSVQKEQRRNIKSVSKFQTDLKDKNRSIIQGVRTNKRFELLMKHRNI